MAAAGFETKRSFAQFARKVLLRHPSRRGGEQLGYSERTARVCAQTKQRPLMKSLVICYLFSDPVRFLEGLLFIRKLYLSQNNACQ